MSSDAWFVLAIALVALAVVVGRKRAPETADMNKIGPLIADNPMSAPDACPPGFITSMSKGRPRCLPIPQGGLIDINVVT